MKTALAFACTNTPKKSARRCLFARPDPAETNEWLENALKAVAEKDRQKFGFDFELGIPLEGTSTAEYVFEPMGEAEVPVFYRSKCLDQTSNSSSPARSEELNNSIDEKSFDCDLSMDYTLSPVPEASRAMATPKKRQAKMTDSYPSRRKRLQRSPKSVEVPIRSSARRVHF